MNKKLLAMLLVLAMVAALLSGCGGSKEQDDGIIRLWVGEESAGFYQRICDE